MTATQNEAGFAAYIKAEWMTVHCDTTGWYITSDVDWCIRKMAKEGWNVRKTGRCELMCDDTFKTYIELL